MIFLVEIYGNKKLCLFDCAATCNLNIDISIIIDLIKPIMILKVHLHMYMIPLQLSVILNVFMDPVLVIPFVNVLIVILEI